MTVRKLLEKYKQIQKDNYEMVFTSMVVNDLWGIIREYMIKR